MLIKRALQKFYEQSLADTKRMLAQHEAEFEVSSAQDLIDKVRISAFGRQAVARMSEAKKNAA